MKSTLGQLQRVGVKKILLFEQAPEFPFGPLRCIQRDESKCKISYSDLHAYSFRFHKIISDVASEFPNVRVIKTSKYFCSETSCSQFQMIGEKKVPIVVDHNHPSAIAVRHFSSLIKKDLSWLISNESN